MLATERERLPAVDLRDCTCQCAHPHLDDLLLLSATRLRMQTSWKCGQIRSRSAQGCTEVRRPPACHRRPTSGTGSKTKTAGPSACRVSSCALHWLQHHGSQRDGCAFHCSSLCHHLSRYAIARQLHQRCLAHLCICDMRGCHLLQAEGQEALGQRGLVRIACRAPMLLCS